MHKSKKGFTIVELVIVIAVIAILAAVLIPTFSNLVKKANQSADQQAVVQMNKLLSTEIQKTAADVDELIEILIDAGYTADLSTYYANYTLGWVKEKNVIVLVENNAAVFPADYEGMTYEAIKPMATSADALAGGLTDGKTVFVGKDITVEEGLVVTEAGEYAVNLNGNTIALETRVQAFQAGSNLVISNGAIETSDDSAAVHSKYSAYVELNNVQVYAKAGSNPIQCYGGTMILNNVTTAQSGNNEKGYYNSAIQVVNGYGADANQKAHLTINGGMYSGDKAIQMSSPGGTIVINDGTFVGKTYAINMDGGPGSGYGLDVEHIITINGGNFSGDIRLNNNNVEGMIIVLNGGTFDGNIVDKTGNVLDVNNYLGAGKTVVDNGNGTWTVK